LELEQFRSPHPIKALPTVTASNVKFEANGQKKKKKLENIKRAGQCKTRTTDRDKLHRD